VLAPMLNIHSARYEGVIETPLLLKFEIGMGLLTQCTIINSERNVTTCLVAMSSFGPRPLTWEASCWSARVG
jgi:hypothetical protein